MNLQEAFGNIKKSLSISKKIDIGEYSVVLEPLTSEEEVKTLEACKDLDGHMYLVGFKLHTLAYAIRALNGERLPNEFDSLDENGKSIKKTRYLAIVDILSSWDTALRDTLYDAYSDLLLELDDKIKKTTKFTRFAVSKESENAGKEEEDAPNGFKKVEESKGDLTEAERLTERAKKEVDEAQLAMARTEQETTRGKR